MNIETTELKRCVLMNIHGRVDSSTAPQLQAKITEVIDEGNFKLVLDMEDIEFISSAGLWVLVNAQKKCKRFNRGEVVLANVSDQSYKALDLAGFIGYYKIFEDSTLAVGHF
jgi:anti-sigma B factor antagonist